VGGVTEVLQACCPGHIVPGILEYMQLKKENTMLWQYRTILFEFTKDGLLGDKYVDDEDMEKTLNEFGAQGWELVNVSLLQDGLLVFLKRPVDEDMPVEQPMLAKPAEPPVVQKRPDIFSRNRVTAERNQADEREYMHNTDRQRKNVIPQDETDFIGGIKIS
jgi:hypothetical protein